MQFTYDAANRRTTLTLPNGITTEYAYDPASRVAALTYRLGTTTLGDLQYLYDAAGNRVQVGGSWARTGLPQGISSATYNMNNQQVTFGGQTLTYDLNGNLVGDGTNTYVWNARNQLTAISGPIPATFDYDGVGRRRQKTIAGTATSLLHDGLNPVQAQQGPNVATIVTGLRTDEFFSRTDGAGARHFLTDVIGSTIGLGNDVGTVSTEYTYEPFGAATLTGTATMNPFDYTGRENDFTGLRYHRARYYHPQRQRFIAEDPISFGGGDANVYVYAGNSPTQLTDSLGLSPWTNTLGASIWLVLGGRKGCLSADSSTGTSATPPHVVFPSGLEWLAWYGGIEAVLGRLLIGGGSIVAGSAVGATGLVLAGASIGAVPATGGLSLIPGLASLPVVAAGQGLVIFGATIVLNEGNNLINVINQNVNTCIPYIPTFFPPVRTH